MAKLTDQPRFTENEMEKLYKELSSNLSRPQSTRHTNFSKASNTAHGPVPGAFFTPAPHPHHAPTTDPKKDQGDDIKPTGPKTPNP